jgi:hypothetical protein
MQAVWGVQGLLGKDLLVALLLGVLHPLPVAAAAAQVLLV